MKRPWWHYVPHALLVAAAALLLNRLRLVLAPFVVAYLLAAILDPLVVRLETRGWRRGTAVAGIFALFFALVALALVVVVPMAIRQLSSFAAQVPHWVAEAPKLVEKLQTRYGAAEIPEPVRAAAALQAQGLGKLLLNQIAGLLGSAGFLLSLVIIPLATLYLLVDLRHVRKRLLLWVPEAHQPMAQAIAQDVATVFVSYLRGLTTVSLLFGTTVFIVLLALHIPYALALGTMAAVLYPLPYVGQLITALTLLLVGGFTRGWGYGAGACAGAVLANQFFDQVVAPRVVGKSVGLHPVLSMIALLIGADLFGLVGMVIAVPAAGAIQVTLLRLLPWLRAGEEAVGPRLAGQGGRTEPIVNSLPEGKKAPASSARKPSPARARGGK